MAVEPVVGETGRLGAGDTVGETGRSGRPEGCSDLRAFLAGVLEKALRETGGARGSVVLVDPVLGDLVILDKHDPDGPWPPPPDQKVRLRFRVGEGIAGYVAQTGRVHYAHLAAKDPHFVAPHVRRSGNWSLLAVPIVSTKEGGDRRTIGVISVEGPEGKRNFFNRQAKTVLAALAEEAVACIEGAALSALVQETLSTYRLRRILAVSQMVVSQQGLDQILQQIARIAFEELRADVLTLYRWDADNQQFITPPITLGEFYYPDAMRTQIHRGDIVDRVFHQWGSRYFTDARSDPQLRSLGRVPPRDGQAERERFPVRENIVSSAILRLEVGAKRVGVLCVNWRSLHRFDDSEKAILGIFANHVALAIENDRLMRVAIEQATRDQRERLHRNLHDEVGGKLTAIKHLADTLRTLVAKSQTHETDARLQEIEELAIKANLEVKNLLSDLQPLADLTLETDLPRLCSELSASSCTASSTIDGPVAELRAGIAEGVYRIAREAIVNANRHGMATQIDVRLQIDPERLRLDVVDNGHGQAPPAREERRSQQRFGLTIMEQLAYTMGGELGITTHAAASGWRVTLTVPSPLATVRRGSLVDKMMEIVPDSRG